MTVRRRDLGVALLLLAGAAVLGWLGLKGFVWSDYEAEALVPFNHLVAGEWTAFVNTAPGYAGSLVIRAPFALAASLLGGGEVAIYRAVAAPCLLAAAVWGFVLWRERRLRHPAAGWALAFALLAAMNPLTLRALEIGHPEDLLGGVLCAAAVFAAIKRRPWAAAILLGLAIGNKAWAVLAIGPVLVALDRHHLKVLVLAGAVSVAIMAPFALSETAASRVAVSATETSTIFQPWQVWWFLGDTGHVVRGADGLVKPGYRVPPAWISPLSHPLIAVSVVPLTLLFWWRRRGRRLPVEDAMLLLALLMLLRCILDPWNISYYHLPFLLALVGWEALRFARPPVLTLACVVAVWGTWEKLVPALPADAESVAYLAWALPLAAGLAWRAFSRSAPREQQQREPERVAPARGELALAGPARP